MDHDDIIRSHYQTAQTTHTNNLRRQTTRQAYAQDDAESRAFHAERDLLVMKQALEIEQREHALTRMALKQLLAQNIGLQKSVAHLAKKWAPIEGTTIESFTAAVLAKGDAIANALHLDATNETTFARDVERLREAQRLGPKLPK